MTGSGSSPFYSQIISWIKEQIAAEALKPGDKLPTELELAEQFSVSRITSKRALEELKREGLIFRKRGQGSFVSDSVATGRQTGEHTLISMIIPHETTKGKLVNYLKGASSVLNSKGYFLAIHSTDNDDSIERDLLKNLPEESVAGLLYYPIDTMNHLDILNILAKKKFPIVTIDKYFDHMPISSVVSDNKNGSLLAVNHLVGLEHRNISFITSGNINTASSTRDRFFGYCDGLSANNIEINQDYIVTDYYIQSSQNGSELKWDDYLEEELKKITSYGVTAIIAENDYVAVSITNALTRIGLTVPDDISVVGFDNVAIIDKIDWELTTLNQDIFEIGRAAAELLLQIIEYGKQEYVRKSIPVDLVVRNTTALCKKK